MRKPWGAVGSAGNAANSVRGCVGRVGAGHGWLLDAGGCWMWVAAGLGVAISP